MVIGRNQIKALELQYQGLSTVEIAEQLKVSGMTIKKWQDDADYRAALSKAVGQNLATLLPKAIANLREIMDDEHAKPSLKLAATKIVLDYYANLVAPNVQTDINVRVEYV